MKNMIVYNLHTQHYPFSSKRAREETTEYPMIRCSPGTTINRD